MSAVSCGTVGIKSANASHAAQSVWHAISLLLVCVALVTVAPYTLTAQGADCMRQLALGLLGNDEMGAVAANMAQGLTGSGELWIVPGILWLMALSYLVLDAASMVAELAPGISADAKCAISRIRSMVFWPSAIALALLLILGLGERILRGGYTSQPEVWTLRDGSAIEGVAFTVLSVLLLMPSIWASVKLSHITSRLVNRQKGTLRWMGMVSNGAVSWAMAVMVLAAGAYALPLFAGLGIAVASMVIGLWIVVKVLPFVLKVLFVHLLCSRTI